MEKSRISEWELHDNFGVLTINNPPQNYLEGFKLADLEDLKRWTDNDSLRGIVITGKGRHFCAGFNKEDLYRRKGKEGLLEQLREGNQIVNYLENLPVPVVAAIRGVCFGGGLELALSCDIRVCGEKALLSFPETGIGIIPGLNGTVRLPRQIGLCKALNIVLGGSVVHADEALGLGIVDHVVPTKEVFEFSLNLLEGINYDKPVAIVNSVMKSLHNARDLTFDEATEEETKLFSELVLARLRTGREYSEDGAHN